MKKNRLFATVMCLALMLASLPATACAADGYANIGGLSVSLSTPYYFNDSGGEPAAMSSSPTLNGRDWNAHLEKNSDTTYTLYLRGFSLSTDMTQAIITTNIDTLCLDLEGGNSVSTTNADSGAAAISCNNLVVCGDGTLVAAATNGADNGIAANSIRLQYSAKLTVSGTRAATSAQVTCSEGLNAYRAADNADVDITDYFSDASVYPNKPYVRFTPKSGAFFPLWVNGVRVTATNMGNIPIVSGAASYTPAKGAAPARLTLTDATISSSYTSGYNIAGVYTEESLEIHLKGSNTINITAVTYGNIVSGVFVNGPALTITAQTGASLRSNVTASVSSNVNCYGICGAGNITINGGNITAEGIADAGEGRGITADGVLSVNGGSVIAESNDGPNGFAVWASSLVLGTGMGVITPVNATAPSSAKKYVTDSAGNAAKQVEIGTARYAVTYDANGGSGAMTPGTATYGSAFTLPACGFTAPSAQQRFKEWAVGSAAGTKVSANGSFSFTANTTVYAVWENLYQITEGRNGNWTNGSGVGLRFIADADFRKFTAVLVDNSAISDDKFTAESGSTVVTLTASYLSTLSAGQHTLRINFSDGYAETSFTVASPAANRSNPDTGNHTSPWLWPCVALTAGAGLAADLVFRRKRENG